VGLTAGSKLGPYEVGAPLGAGGMGEVYRARDTRLDRSVAIKILPQHLSTDSAAKQRFEREARAISSLSHANICQLYDVGNQDGTDFLVMEFLEGETMADRLTKGPLPLEQVLRHGAEICEGLEKAHRSGVVHRDLKPGNIMLTKSGAKLMDFGLAKAGMPENRPTSGLSKTFSSPVLTHPLTARGTLIGTFQYMSPEQVEGKEADTRSDIFSLGAVLYEMVTGKRAFEGKSQISVASAILEKDPEPVTTVQPLAPATLDHVIRGCIAKDPEARWQSAADIGRELRWISSSGSSAGVARPAGVRRRTRERLVWAAVVTALLGVMLWHALRRQELARPLRSYLLAPAEESFDFTGDFAGPPVLSGDGSAVAYCARTQRERDSIWVQSLSDLTAKKLDGTEGASFPFWSADGKFLGFFADGHLKKIPTGGGPVTVLADAANARGGTWSRDNVILFEPDYRDVLWRINASGGTATRVTKFEGTQTTHRWPQFLPDGKHFLFFATNHSDGSQQGIYYGSLDDGSYKRVLDADSGGQYASGYLLYHLQTAVFAQKFDRTTGTVSGDPIPVANFVEYDAGVWHTTFTASQNGLLLYELGSKTLGTDLSWMDRSGKVLGKAGERAPYKGSGRFSPDGKRLAVSMGDPQADIWVFDLARGSRTRLTFGGATYLAPSWSADGQRVVYVRQSGATLVTGTSLRARLASGGGQEEILMEGGAAGDPHTLLLPQWSPDGQYLVHMEQSGPSGAGIWALPTGKDKKPFSVVQPPSAQARIAQFRLSPDGRWLAYSSTESGREELYVTHFPDGAGRWQISQSGGTFPAWRGDGREIFFVGWDGQLHSATLNPKSQEFQLDQERPLFPIGYTSPIGNAYDVTPDGQRFVFTTLPEGASTPLVMVTNWTSDLEQK
jgi:eukaryotic-like serine/threonine-protein kinase